MISHAVDRASLEREAPTHYLFGRFRLLDWAAVGLGLETREEWRDWARTGTRGEVTPSPTPAIPALLRRRVTPIGQAALRAAYPLARANARYVLCSRHGEFQRTLGLLRSVANREESSPAEFSLSVHNALAGLLSIATGNHVGHTAIAAGVDSFGFGLVEALGCLVEQPEEPVLLVYFDEALPAPYDELPDVHDEPGIALALLLAPAEMTSDDLAFSAEPCTGSDPHASASSQALGFLEFILSDRTALETRGSRMVWRWERGS
jgi:hypothetical protein